MQDKITKIVDSLESNRYKIDKISDSFIGKEKEKHDLLSNISFDLDRLIERLDEFNLNQ